ncbi:uncharacterized protein LOC104854252 [Fukomys damarensis]|uniref:uncharacterized protein LOC104854252 n=1 Tax=Fukomys damarensis TaxID=885580 RepID=UPI00053F8E17|nr:uncharacterized protein LOC104854252 [Fukomys damarensis]
MTRVDQIPGPGPPRPPQHGGAISTRLLLGKKQDRTWDSSHTPGPRLATIFTLGAQGPGQTGSKIRVPLLSAPGSLPHQPCLLSAAAQGTGVGSGYEAARPQEGARTRSLAARVSPAFISPAPTQDGIAALGALWRWRPTGQSPAMEKEPSRALAEAEDSANPITRSLTLALPEVTVATPSRKSDVIQTPSPCPWQDLASPLQRDLLLPTRRHPDYGRVQGAGFFLTEVAP